MPACKTTGSVSGISSFIIFPADICVTENGCPLPQRDMILSLFSTGSGQAQQDNYTGISSVQTCPVMPLAQTCLL